MMPIKLAGCVYRDPLVCFLSLYINLNSRLMKDVQNWYTDYTVIAHFSYYYSRTDPVNKIILIITKLEIMTIF